MPLALLLVLLRVARSFLFFAAFLKDTPASYFFAPQCFPCCSQPSYLELAPQSRWLSLRFVGRTQCRFSRVQSTFAAILDRTDTLEAGGGRQLQQGT